MVTTRQQERINALRMRSYYRHRRHQRHQCRRITRHIENENELNALYNADDAQLTGLFSLKHFVGQAVHSFPYHCRSYAKAK